MPGKTMDELLLGKEITKRNCGFSTFKKIKKHVDFFFFNYYPSHWELSNI